MNFFEAAEVAKKNPGSHFTRGESGLFVVHLKNGGVITSLEQLGAAPSPPTSTDGETCQAHNLSQSIASLQRQLETFNVEIQQLRREVNSLKEAIAKIPASEWSRYEEEHKKLDLRRQADERDRIVGLVRSGKLSHEQLNLVADNAGPLGISNDDLGFIRAEIRRTRPRGISPDSLVVHANTDGQ